MPSAFRRPAGTPGRNSEKIRHAQARGRATYCMITGRRRLQTPRQAPTAYNNTGRESPPGCRRPSASNPGARYDNASRLAPNVPAPSARSCTCPSSTSSLTFVAAMERAGCTFLAEGTCASLVRFLAFGGFRKSEAAQHSPGGDCDFAGKQVAVSQGDPETGPGERRGPFDVPDDPRYGPAPGPPEGRATGARPLAMPVMLVRECQKAMDRAAQMVGIPRIRTTIAAPPLCDAVY